MGGAGSTMADEFAAYRELFAQRRGDEIVARFASGAVVHFFNAQDSEPVVFVGADRIRDFFTVYLRVFPAFDAKLVQDQILVLGGNGQPSSEPSTPRNSEQAQAQAQMGEEEPLDTAPMLDRMDPASIDGGADDEVDGEDGDEDGDEEKDLEPTVSGMDMVESRRMRVLKTFWDDRSRIGIVHYKFPQKGYRFIQETLVVGSSGQWQALSITMDSSTDFSGLWEAPLAAGTGSNRSLSVDAPTPKSSS